MNIKNGIRIAGILGAAMLATSCATNVKTEVLIPAGKGDLGIQRLTVYPVKNAQNDREDQNITAELQAMFVNAEVRGERKFDVLSMSDLGSIQEQQKVERQALRGSFDQSTVSFLRAKGVQGLVFATFEQDVANKKSQEKRNKSIVNCIKRTVTVTLYPRIVRVSDARVVVQDRYSGAASSRLECGNTSLDGANPELAREARAIALRKLREDVAPFTRTKKAVILTNFCGEKGSNIWDKNTGKFLKGSTCDSSSPSAQVVELVEGGASFAKADRMDTACEKWTEAASQHSKGFIIPYLQGVCAEILKSDLKKAASFYQVADKRTTRPVTAINDALIRIGMKSSAPEKSAPVRKPDPTVMAVQEALLDAGYAPGVADGFMGAKTKEALQFFQEDSGLDVTGEIDDATKQELAIPPS